MTSKLDIIKLLKPFSFFCFVLGLLLSRQLWGFPEGRSLQCCEIFSMDLSFASVFPNLCQLLIPPTPGHLPHPFLPAVFLISGGRFARRSRVDSRCRGLLSSPAARGARIFPLSAGGRELTRAGQRPWLAGSPPAVLGASDRDMGEARGALSSPVLFSFTV